MLKAMKIDPKPAVAGVHDSCRRDVKNVSPYRLLDPFWITTLAEDDSRMSFTSIELDSFLRLLTTCNYGFF